MVCRHLFENLHTADPASHSGLISSENETFEDERIQTGFFCFLIQGNRTSVIVFIQVDSTVPRLQQYST